MANIRKIEGKTGVSYKITVSSGRAMDNKQIRHYLTWTPEPGMTERQTIKEMNRVAAEFEKSITAGFVPDNRITFAEYAEYVMQLKERDLKPNTISMYRYLLHNLLPEIGHLKLKDITPRLLNALYAKLGEDGRNKKTGGKLSGKTIIEYARFISIVLEQASDELLVPFNAAKKAQPPKRIRGEISCLQPEELKRLFDALKAAPIKWKALIYLLAASGARRGEILALKWNQIDFKNSQIEITGNLLYSPERGIYETSPKTKGSIRFIKLPQEAMSVLKEYKIWYNQIQLAFGAEWAKTNYVFVQEGEHPGFPMHPDSVSAWISKFAKKNGLPHCTAHTFRHSLASILISEGTDVVSVSRRLGHTDISTTLDIYSHAIKRADERAADSIADVLFR